MPSQTRSKDLHKVLAAHEREKKKKHLWGLPRATLTLLPIPGFNRWSPHQRSKDLAEEIIYPACRETGETLLRSLRICQHW